MSAYKGYLMKCSGCTFMNPAFKRDGYKFAPKLVEVADATTLASGKLTIKVLPHYRRKIWCSFPVMTPEQFRVYYRALQMDKHGPDMYLTIETYDFASDSYITDVYYHNDIMYKPIIYGGRMMIQIDDFELIGH